MSYEETEPGKRYARALTNARPRRHLAVVINCGRLLRFSANTMIFAHNFLTKKFRYL